jgi:perosamine synthetase
MLNEIPLFKVHKPEGIGETLQKVWDSGMVSEGPKAALFETEFGKFIKNQNVVLTNSGTSALDLAYACLGLEENQEVISSPMTCAATNEPLANRDTRVVWADVDPSTGNITLDAIKRLVSPKTRAVVAVMWGGVPFDPAIRDFLFERKIYLVIDAAHALGARWTSKKVLVGEDCLENQGTITCFSFQAIKHLTTGDGGAVAFCPFNMHEGAGWAGRARKLRWFGLDRTYVGSKWEQDIKESGFKYHMNDMNASIGLLQLNYVQDIIRKHKMNAAYFDMYMNNPLIGKSKINTEVVEPSWWLYTIHLNNSTDRKKFQTYLKEKGIGSDVVHVRNDQYTCFSKYQREGLEFVGLFDRTHLCIPVGWWLSDEDREYIVSTVNSYEG